MIKDYYELIFFLKNNGFDTKTLNALARDTNREIGDFFYGNRILANVHYPINEYEYIKLINDMCKTNDILKVRNFGKMCAENARIKSQEYLDKYNKQNEIKHNLSDYTTLELLEEIKRRIE